MFLKNFSLICYFIFCVFIYPVECLAAPLPDKLRFKQIDLQDTEFLGEVISLHQDRFGFIWIGGKSGLARYDGYDFKVFRHSPEDPGSISNNTIWAIVEDEYSNLWIATDNGLNRYHRSTGVFEGFFHEPENDSSLLHNRLLSLHLEGSTLWIGGDEGLNSLDLNSLQFTRHPSEGENAALDSHYVMGIDQDENGVFYLATGFGFKVWDRSSNSVIVYGSDAMPKNLPSFTIRSILVGSDGKVWLGTQRGLARFDPDLKKFESFAAPEGSSAGIAAIWKLLEDNYGDLWAASDGEGLMRLKKGDNKLVAHKENDFDPFSNSTNAVRTIIQDHTGDLWLGGYPSKLAVIHRHHSAFQTFRNSSNDDRSINAKGVMSFLEQENGSLWIGTDTGGLNYLDAETQRFTFYTYDENNPSSISSNGVMTLLQDKQGHIWTGHWNGGLSRLDPVTQKFRRYPADPGNPDAIQNVHVWTSYLDSYGNMWFGQLGGGLAQYLPDKDSFVTYSYKADNPQSLIDNHVWSIVEDSFGFLWVGTQGGLVRLDLMSHDPEHVNNPEINHHRFTRFTHNTHDASSISNSWVISLFEDSQRRLWLGTQGGGLNLYNRESESFTSIQTSDGLPSDVIVSIHEDNSGRIWVGTEKGLASYEPNKNKVFNYSVESGIQANLFNYESTIKLRSGELLFGGVSGYTRFDPAFIEPNQFAPKIVFTDLRILNKPVSIGGESLEKNILIADKLKLDHTHNVFSVDFAALNYRNGKDNLYTYILEGFDNDWSPVNSFRSATYTNLDPGHYVFRVKGSNNEGVWSPEGSSFAVEVYAAPWRTWWAYMFYVLICGGLVLWYLRTQRKMLEYKDSMVKNLQEVDMLKDEFMATTSHELRTPLFGIVGLAETMADKSADHLNDDELHTLSMIIASGKRLSAQVDDILDFSKMRSQSLQINVKPFDLSVACDMVISLSKPLIGDADLKLINNVKQGICAVSGDENRFQQILHNLVVNAIRNTESGSVIVSASFDNKTQMITIAVKDTGVGIPKEKFDDLFIPFTQLGSKKRQTYGGAGLGLSICKTLVNLHGGEIWVESQEGVGSTFKFTLPAADGPAERSNISYSLIDRLQSKSEEQTTPPPRRVENASAHILIVDDESVNRMVLRGFLSKGEINGKPFNLSEAKNGHDAMTLISQDTSINLILMDVMMPDMSGFEVCTKIRETISAEKLPIIFITANRQESDRDEAYRAGGNDFLPKPVERDVLINCVIQHLPM